MRDFDDLVNLYAEDPDKFDKEVLEVIEDFISSCPPERQQSLRQQQWKIQGELRKYKDPQARLNKMVELFYEGLKEFQESLESLVGPRTVKIDPKPEPPKPPGGSKVINFKNKVDNSK